MTNEVINALVIAFILAISVSVLFWGIKKRNITRTSLGGALLLFSLFVLLDRFPKYAETFSAWATLLLAIGAFIAVAVSIWIVDRRTREENRVRSEGREHESKKRCLEELQGWIYEVVRIKTESASPKGTDLEWRQRNTNAKILASKREYIESEAARLDSEFMTEKREEQLVSIIGRVSFILEQHSSGASLSNEQIQAELEQKCATFLKRLSNIRTIGKL